MRERRIALLVLITAVFGLTVALLFWYLQDRGIPLAVVTTALPAFLLEAGLYVASGLAPVRERLTAWRPHAVAALLTGLAPLSWLFLTLPLHEFTPGGLALLLAMGAAAAFWYVLLPRRLAVDLGFLALLAIPVLARVFNQLYPDPARRVPGEILGLLMWYRTALIAVLVIRKMDGIGFGFLPRSREWLIGLKNYVWFLLIGLALALAIGFVQLRPVTWGLRTALLALLTFAGALWVLAVAEEMFFRGLLQQHLSRLFRSNVAGLIVASMVFGLAHLPNWRLAMLAAIAGVFYGRAFLEARSIRASMVTHALVVTTWRVFLT